MKLNIQLTEEESESINSFLKEVVPPKVAHDDFLKAALFAGLRGMEISYIDSMKKKIEADRANLESSGINVDQIIEEMEKAIK